MEKKSYLVIMTYEVTHNERLFQFLFNIVIICKVHSPFYLQKIIYMYKK